MNLKKALLFHYNDPCTKENGEGHFDVIMKYYDGNEIYKLEGTTLLVN